MNQETKLDDDMVARENWARYRYGIDRGHNEYTEQAKRCEGMYLGGGEQWSEEDKRILASQGRPHYELNQIKPAVNTALGYQINNRMDIALRPRGESGDPDVAQILSKVIKQVSDATGLHWKETQVFGDGLIEQRGYFDVRMSFEDNIKGEVTVESVDPRDVIPDPDAKSYDPDDWGDVIRTRWLTKAEVGQIYGQKAMDALESAREQESGDFGANDGETDRNSFGVAGLADAYFEGSDGIKRFRIIDRQRWVYEMTPCIVFPDTGDVQVEANLSKDVVQDAIRQGAVRARRMKKRIRWEVSTWCDTLHADYSPYEHFTIVPYFPYFRRGKTRGMVDNGIGPQEILNKAVSQFVHILNSSANGGWMVEQDSLTNMDTDDLEERGAETGLVIEYKKGKAPPKRIQPNTVPTGVDRLMDRAAHALKETTVPDAMRGNQGAEVSGIAIQSKQHASQQQLAVPLDNLAFTRRLLALRLLKLIQTYYDSHRVFRITEIDPLTGKEEDALLEINKFDPGSGVYLYDVTVGEYDVIVSEQPMQVTFENSQFQQCMEMREKGVNIPDAVVLRYSNLTDKHAIIESLGSQSPPPDPTLQAKAELFKAQARKADADAGKSAAEKARINSESQYNAIQTAQVVELTPATAPTADALLRSAGFVDEDAAPIVPPASGTPPDPMGDDGGALEPLNPLGPPGPLSPTEGIGMGIETPEADGLR